jgi:hypothetical protein
VAKSAWLLSDLAAGITPTGSTTATGLGWDKLLDPQPRHRARVAATSAFFIRDLGLAKSIDVAALISTSLLVGASVQLRASTADATATSSLLYDSGVVSGVTSVDYRGNVVDCIASPVSARYWRWDITGAVNPIDIGLAPLGLLFRPGRNFQYGAQEGAIDLSKRDRNEDTGGEFIVAGPKVRQKMFAYNGLTKSETRDTFHYSDLIGGGAADVLFVEDPDASALDLARDSIWGSYRAIGSDSFAARVAAQNWARPFRVTERL